MKKLIFAFALVVGVGSFGFSQEGANVAVTKGATELLTSKSTGSYTFVLPSHFTEEMVAKNASYYTSYFTVTFDEASKTANVDLVENTTTNRYIVARFLAACQVRTVQVDENLLEMHDFIATYLE